MKRPFGIAAVATIAGLLLATPLHAQDEAGGGGFGGGAGFGGGGDFGGLDARGGRGAGQQQNNNNNNPRVRDLLTQANPVETLMTLLKAALEKDKAPKLSKDQEKEMNAFLTREAKSANTAIEAKAKELGLASPSAQNPPPIGRSGQDVVQIFLELNGNRGGGNNNNNAGNRGGNRGGNNNNNNNNNNNRLVAQVLRPAEEAFLTTVANAPTLNVKQKTAVLKWKNDVLRQRGGVDEFRVQMEEKGAPLTAQQVTQIQTIFDDTDQKRTALRNDLNQRIRDLLNPGEAQANNQNQQNQNQNNNNNAFNQLQNLGRVDDTKLAAISAEMRKKTDDLDKDTQVKILRALEAPQRQPFIDIEKERLTQRNQQINQQRQQILAPRG